MKRAYIMYCNDDDVGECELWFNESKKCIGAYSCNDASWRGEYYDHIFKSLGVIISYMEYDEDIAAGVYKEYGWL